MAYVLGFIYADGSMEDASYIRGKYFRITSTDQEIILKIKGVINSSHKIVQYKSVFPNRKDRYLLRVGDKKMFFDLKELGLYPNKSKTIKFPEIPDDYLSNFILGYFDGDGCVLIERSRGALGSLVVKRLVTIFTSGSLCFLERLSEKIVGIIGCRRKVYKSHRAFQLKLSTKESVLLFRYMYNNLNSNSLFLTRKFNVFHDYLRLRPSRIDNDGAIILNSLSAD